MRTATAVAIGAAMMLLPSIGSNGTGTMKPEASHVDRALFVRAGGNASDLRAIDASVLRAVRPAPPRLAAPKIDASRPAA